jgi:2-(1,2-epoxy-1,2-dihydrophenyl)acetyl-CoA isomerase
MVKALPLRRSPWLHTLFLGDVTAVFLSPPVPDPGMNVDTDEYEYLDVDRTDGIATVTMDRAEQYNAMNEHMAADLRDAMVELESADEIRCVVLKGTGDAFNTGADLDHFEGDESDGMRLDSLASRLHTAVKHLVQMPKPAITGVNGVAAGGGFGLALAGDLVIVQDGATFDFSYPKLGLTGDAGSTYFLPKLVGPRRARELLLLDEPVEAEEAVEMGLATETVSEDAFANRLSELAEELASGPTRAFGRTKRLFNESYDRSFPDHLDAEQRAIESIAGTDDYARGYEAFQANEEPDFEGN